MKKGLITRKDIEKARTLQYQRCLKTGKKARELGYLSDFDIIKVTRKQTELKKRFLEVAEELDLLSHEQSLHVLEEQRKDYLLFGEALILSDILTDDVVKRELKQFFKIREEFWEKFFEKQKLI